MYFTFKTSPVRLPNLALLDNYISLILVSASLQPPLPPASAPHRTASAMRCLHGHAHPNVHCRECALLLDRPPAYSSSDVVTVPYTAGRDVHIQTRAETRPTADGGLAYRSHTVISTTAWPAPEPRRGHSVAGSHASSRVHSVAGSHASSRVHSVAPSYASSRHTGAAAPPPPMLMPPRPPQSAAPSRQSHRSHAGSQARYYPPTAGQPAPRMPAQGFVVGEVAVSQAPSTVTPSTVAPSSSVSHWATNVEKATRRDREARAKSKVSRSSSRR